MQSVKDIIQQCHDQRRKDLQQRETIVSPTLHGKNPYHYIVYCARQHPLLLHDLEQADISFMPIGQAPFDQGPAYCGGSRLLRRQGTLNWEPRRWFSSWGIQVYTGTPSARDGANWHDIEFTYRAIRDAPDAVVTCVDALVNAVMNPLLTLLKDGGLRFSCRVPDYLHPNTTDAKEYIHKHLPDIDHHRDRDVYVKIIGDKGYTRWDARYEILTGSLSNPPIISKDVLFAFLDVLRELLHEPAPASELDLTDEALVDTQDFDDFDVIESLETEQVVNESLLAVQRGELSPIGIKRPRPLLEKVKHTAVEDERHLSEREAHILGIITGSMSTEKKREIEATFLDTAPIWINANTTHDADDAERYYEEQGVSVGRWKPRNYRWEQAEWIPITERMQNPFARGNVCEDAKRCDALAQKGGDPHRSICPSCPVYDACQARGYLSQFETLKEKQVIVSDIPNLFLDRRYAALVDALIVPDRISIINDSESQLMKLFSEHHLSTEILEGWLIHWSSAALGQFAKTLLNAIRITDSQHGDIAKRIRTVVQAFERLENSIVQQMCQVNCTDKAGNTIAIDTDSAILLGALDISTLKNIEKLPNVYRDSEWTLWHQLKTFFAYYTRDMDAPMFVDDGILRFWLPPRIHQKIQKLVFISPAFSEDGFKKVFPEETVSVRRVEPQETSLSGNKVFQLRSAPHISYAIANYEVKWDVFSLSEIARRFFRGIYQEMKQHPDRNQVVISSTSTRLMLKNVFDKIVSYHDLIKNTPAHPEDLRTHFEAADVYYDRINVLQSIFEAADVVWIVGTPYWPPKFIWEQAKILFGNQAEPLNYNLTMNPYQFEDERIQELYEQNAIGTLTQIVRIAGFNKASGKTLILNTPLRIPSVTDAPETELFDWEDFELAGGLNELSETIRIREKYEVEYASMDASWNRKRVEYLLGVSKAQANRILMRLRGGKLERTPFHVQIFELLSDGQKTTSEIVEAIDGNPGAIKNELTHLVEAGEIVRIQRGVYTLA
ncbi:hypothetical protein C6499_13540 [Candidatus Poribacteria bacterium]|nr:MAG: hypothetical protein C6499_13540 [Candidatus Poribacteria bacterium]